MSTKKTLLSLGLLEEKVSIHSNTESRADCKGESGSKEDLQKRLSKLLGGTTNLPVLLHSNENFDVSQRQNIKSYEVLCTRWKVHFAVQLQWMQLVEEEIYIFNPTLFSEFNWWLKYFPGLVLLI